MNHSIQRILTLLLAVVAATLARAQDQPHSLDETCLVSALNRSARVREDGSWVLPNVPSNFGQIRVRATCLDGGVSRSGQSGFFTLPFGGVARVADIAFDSPQQIPSTLSIASPVAVLNAVGETVALLVTATFADGSTGDATPSASGTNYRSSNPATATVSADGLVSAVASGTVLISATNEGALALLQLRVAAGADSDGDGLPDDFEIDNGLDPNNPADALEDRDGDGLATLDEFQRGLDPFNPDTDGDGLFDGAEVKDLGTDPLLFDSDDDGISDGLELSTGTDPLDSNSFNYAAVLVSLEVLPPTFALIYDTIRPEASIQLTAIGRLTDGTSVDLSSPSRGTSYLSSDLGVCSFSAEPARIFAGIPGDCTISAVNSGSVGTAHGLVQTFSPVLVGSVEIPGGANDVAVVGDYAFVAAGAAGLQVVDISDRRLPTVTSAAATPGTANAVTVDGPLAYLADGAGGLQIVDVSDPLFPSQLGGLLLPGDALGIANAPPITVLADGSGGIQIVDTSDPQRPTLLASAATSAPALDVELDETATTVFVAVGAAGIEVFSLAVPTNPVRSGGLPTPDARAVAVRGDYLFLADFVNSFSVINVLDPALPFLEASTSPQLTGLAVDIAIYDDLAFVADIGFFANDAIPLVDISTPQSPVPRALLPLGRDDPGRAVVADQNYVYLAAGRPGTGRLHIGQYLSLDDPFAEAPTITITSPDEGDRVSPGSVLQLRATADDDVGILAVDFLVNGSRVGRDQSPPYGAGFVVPDATGVLSIGAEAFDFAANRTRAREVDVAILGMGQTTITDTVEDALGAPVAEALVVLPQAANTVSDSDGNFTLLDIPVVGGAVVVLASAFIDGAKHRGASAPTVLAVGGTTDVGAIALEPLELLYPGPRILSRNAIAMAEADFDLDGLRDLAIVHFAAQGGVEILRGRGDGRYTTPQRQAIVGADFLVAGDLDLDGAPDLVVGSSTSGQLSVLVNDGFGALEIRQGLAAAGSPRGGKMGDFDSDGLLDLAVVNRVGDDVSIFLGNGDGSLRAPIEIPVGGSPEDLVVTDFDHDGRLDFATPNRDDLTLSVVLGDGKGAFSSAGPIPVDSLPLRLGSGDLDVDGITDLVFATGDSGASSGRRRLFVQLGLGDGSFALASTVGGSIGGTPIAMAVSDLDVDGFLDVVVARDTTATCDDLRILRGDGRGQFPFGDIRTLADGCRIRDVVTTTSDQDTFPDLVALDEWGATTYLGIGDALFESLTAMGNLGAPRQAIASFDMDLDSHLDIVSFPLFGSPLLSKGNGDGSFESAVPAGAGLSSRSMAIGYIDGDGAPDIIVAQLGDLAVLLGNGDGTFSSPILTPTPRGIGSLLLSDLTSDGGVDVVATISNLDAVLVFEGQGGGAFALATTLSTGLSPQSAVISDFSGDGRQDLATANKASEDVSVFLGNGDGSFGPELRFAAGNDPVSITSADFNLDGIQDLAVANGPTRATESDGASILLGNGDGSFQAASHLYADGNPRRVTVTDADGDGVSDLVLVNNETDDLTLILGRGDGSFETPERFRTGQGPVWIDAADINHDGRPDLITADEDHGRISLLLHR